ncbi:MAG: hypothetical protein AAF909_11970 [Pseudomonadota bacterium]
MTRLVEWWWRTRWGWLVILGPVLCYSSLLYSMDLVGLAADRDAYFRLVDPRTAFRSGVELDLMSMAGRMEYALVSALYVLVAGFSILWALPRILARPRNPFGGFFGLLLAVGFSVFLYYVYSVSEYNIRVAFADDILKLGEQAGAVPPIGVSFAPFGLLMYDGQMPQSVMLERMHSVVYLIGNTAPWVLIVYMAMLASFEPRMLGKEEKRALRLRMTHLQIGMALAALNIVLSVAYLRTMMAWPVKLFEEELATIFLFAATRYAAVLGALGSLMLITVLAPAYYALNQHFDRVAEHELLAAGDDDGYVSFQERLAWRSKHGLLLSSQQAITAAAAVLAPLLTAPTLEGATEQGRPASQYEQSVIGG